MSRQALTFGVDASPLLQQPALLSSTVGVAQVTSGEYCSGILLDELTVITAQHCVDQSAASEVCVEDGSREVGVDGIELHPTLDVALLNLTSALPKAFYPVASPADVVEGGLVELVGAGSNEQQQIVGPQSLAVTVTEATKSQGSVTARGLGGACLGDSGGGIFVRSERGLIALTGVLTSGAESCFGVDHFVPTAAIYNWLPPPLTAAEAWGDQCGNLGPTGGCFGETAVWCSEPGRLSTETCTAGRACGYQAGVGFRCGGTDCGGVDQIGSCSNNVASVCHGGQLDTEACTPDSLCVLSPQSGSFACMQKVWTQDECKSALNSAEEGQRCVGEWSCADAGRLLQCAGGQTHIEESF